MCRIVFFSCLIFSLMGFAQNRTLPKKQAQELGKVAWYRDFDQAIVLSKKQNKPVFMLFQEVPGCLTCRNYGKGVLSNEVIVETIEKYFIPLAILITSGGKIVKCFSVMASPAGTTLWCVLLMLRAKI